MDFGLVERGRFVFLVFTRLAYIGMIEGRELFWIGCVIVAVGVGVGIVSVDLSRRVCAFVLKIAAQSFREFSS